MQTICTLLVSDVMITLIYSSLKTEENLEVVKALPTSRLMLETDSPWCDLRKTHAGTKYAKTDLTERYPAVKKEKWKPDAMVKSRNEPVTIL